MHRSIGINQDKEAAAMMRYKKFPSLKHTTKVNTEYVCDNESEDTANCCNGSMEFELCVNGHTYKMNKQNLAAIGVGAVVAFSAYKAFKMFSRV